MSFHMVDLWACCLPCGILHINIKSTLYGTGFYRTLCTNRLIFWANWNFINGELWGRISYADVSHLMYFPQAARVDFEMIQANPALQDITANIGGYLLLPRHPSQLYQAATEGILLFVVLWWFSAKPRPPMPSQQFLLVLWAKPIYHRIFPPT